MPTPKVVVLLGFCTKIGCKKRSTSAKRTSDFWIERCDEHENASIDLTKANMYKVGRYIPRYNVYEIDTLFSKDE